jgi:dual specificity MAP kinase phosphatase
MDFSQINDFLFIGTTPRPEDYPALHELGVKLVINMRVERRPHPDPNDPPMRTLWLPSFDNPLFPIPLRTLHQGVEAALETIDRGGKVYSHCAAGVHRSVALGAVILFALGFTLEEAFHLIKQRRKVADPNVWYIRRRIERFADHWKSDPQTRLDLSGSI